jgi:serine/threonine-protein kinase RsbT
MTRPFWRVRVSRSHWPHDEQPFHPNASARNGVPAVLRQVTEAGASGTLEEVRVRCDSDEAIVEARRQARRLATRAGLTGTDLTIVVTAIAELAGNALLYAHGGEVAISMVRRGHRQGVLVVVTDQGPGIANLAQALQDGYSTSGRLGLGLPGVKRLMDEFAIGSAPGHGTTVSARKWKS